MSQSIGIDFGAYQSSIAVFAQNRIVAIANEEGATSTPSVVFFPETGKPVIGSKARRTAGLAPERVLMPAQLLAAAPPPSAFFPLSSENMPNLEQATAALFRKLAHDAGSASQNPITEATVVVPCSFDTKQRSIVLQAAQHAGIQAHLIEGAVAASLAYIVERKTHTSQNETLLILDLGASRLEASVVEIADNTIEVCASAADPGLGSAQIDQRIAGHFAELCRQEQGIDLQQATASRYGLLRLAEQAKIDLSSVTRTRVELPMKKGKNEWGRFRTVLTREDLETLAGDLFDRSLSLTAAVLHASGRWLEEIDGLLLLGGGIHSPAIKTRLHRFFGSDLPTVREGTTTVIAKGAALYAATRHGILRPMTFFRTSAFPIGARMTGTEEIKEIFPHGVPMPARQHTRLHAIKEKNNTWGVDILTWTHKPDTTSDNLVSLPRLIGHYRRSVPEGEIPKKPQTLLEKNSSTKRDIVFEIDEDGILSADLVSSGKQKESLRFFRSAP